MAITIKKVTTRRELERFIRFNYLLYKNNPYSVPDLFDDMLNTFNKKKNAAFEFCEADYFLAYREGKIVGRVAAIINHKANQTWNKKEVRFGWIDFIDDAEVSDALIRTVEEWGKERGMTHIQGPLGFTDFDAEFKILQRFCAVEQESSARNLRATKKYGCFRTIVLIRRKMSHFVKFTVVRDVLFRYNSADISVINDGGGVI
mgnify:CR=1 FL=1